jgi:hypothetical protein
VSEMCGCARRRCAGSTGKVENCKEKGTAVTEPETHAKVRSQRQMAITPLDNIGTAYRKPRSGIQKWPPRRGGGNGLILLTRTGNRWAARSGPETMAKNVVSRNFSQFEFPLRVTSYCEGPWDSTIRVRSEPRSAITRGLR